MVETPSQVEATLLELCGRRLPSDGSVTAETDLLDENLLDSLLVLDLVHGIEKRYGVAIADDDISPRNFRSLRTLAALVVARCGDGDKPAASVAP
jgi:acyl carrier protein